MISTRNIVLSGASFAALAQALTVATPSSLVQCQPAQLRWGEGSAPYYVSIIPGGQPSAAPLQSLPDQTGESYTWMVDLPAGTSITVQVRDSTGEINYSDQVTIQAGTTTECSSGAAAAPVAGSSSAAAAGADTSAAVAAGTSSAASRMTASSAAGIATTRTSVSPVSATTGAGNSTNGVNAAAASPSSSTTGAASVSAKVGAGLFLGAAGALVALVL